MKCLIGNRCVKLFGRAIHCLSRIGDELFFEALKDGLGLRTVNSSRSAYACFLFKENFFTEYSQECEQIDNSNPAELLKCKISMKSVLAIFKSLATIEKTVEHCKIEFKPTECRLIFTLYCKHGITKTHNLTYQECESLQAVFSKELCPNLIQTQAKVLQETVSNFPNSCEEISLTVSPDSVKIKNYVDDEPDPTKVVHTEMSLAPEEFDNFQIGIDTVVTFCLKELRAILAFSEFVNQPITLHFEHAGKPIVFSLNNDASYCGDFVMATLAENDLLTQQNNNSIVTSQDTQVSSKKPNEKQNKMKGRKNTKTLNSRNNQQKERNDDQRVPKRKSDYQNKVTSQVQSSSNRNDDSTQNVPVCNQKDKQQKKVVKQSKDTFFTDSFPYEEDLLEEPRNTTQKTITSTQKTITSTQINNKLNTSILRNISQRDTLQNSRTMDIIIDAEDDDDILMSTPPPSKKTTKNFFCEYKETTPKKENMLLLAADTDDEDD